MTVWTSALKLQIETLREAKIGPAKIARQLGINPNTFKAYLHRSKLVAGLPPKDKLPKHYFNGRNGRLVRRYLEDYPMARLDDIMAACDLTCHKSTLCRFLTKRGLTRTRAKRNILLKDVNRAKRIEFAKKMLQKSDEELKLIMFTDETMVKAYPNGEVVYYRAFQEQPDIVSPRVQQGGAGQMLWGGISFYAYGQLHAIDGHMNSQRYLQLLRTHVKAEMNASERLGRILTFQQDNAKCHKTAEVMRFLENWGYEVLEWPPQSPDLSPIENIWNVMKMKMKALRPRPRTKATMRNAMMDIWDGLADETRQKLTLSFRKRLEQCIANKGGLVQL
jgi:transposase